MKLHDPGAILLISCYELGHQPLAAASPVGFMRRAEFAPDVLDIAVDPFDEAKVQQARFVGISVPMHTALRLGVRVAERVRAINPDAKIQPDTCYGHWRVGTHGCLLVQPISRWGVEGCRVPLSGGCEFAEIGRASVERR